jgi:lipopolysaccharide export system protein LptA
MRSSPRIAGAVLLVGLLAATPAVAESKLEAAAATPGGQARDAIFGDLSLRNRREPIQVKSDKLEFSYKQRLLTYSGEVVVTQGDLTLHADRLEVQINDSAEGGDRLEQIIATGNVDIAQGKRAASGGRAVFDQRRRTIVLSENAVLSEGPNRISGERVVVYIDEERSVVEGGDRRVQAVLYPGENLEGLGEAKGTPP